MTIATAAKSTRILSIDFKSFVIAKLIGSGMNFLGEYNKMSDRLLTTTYRFEVKHPNAKQFRRALVLQKSRIEVKAVWIWAS